MLVQALTLSLFLAGSLVVGLGLGIRAEPSAGTRPTGGLI